MVLVAPRSAKLVEAHGARFTLLLGYVFVPARLPHDAGAVEGGHRLLAGRRSATRSSASASASPARPPRTRSPARSRCSRAGMASGTADLQRDLGGAIMQSIFGALLTAGYAAARRRDRGLAGSDTVNDSVQTELTKSFSSAADTAAQLPAVRTQIIAAAKTSFLQGDQWAYPAGIIAVLLGAALVFFMFPQARRGAPLLAAYHAEA